MNLLLADLLERFGFEGSSDGKPFGVLYRQGNTERFTPRAIEAICAAYEKVSPTMSKDQAKELVRKLAAMGVTLTVPKGTDMAVAVESVRVAVESALSKRE